RREADPRLSRHLRPCENATLDRVPFFCSLRAALISRFTRLDTAGKSNRLIRTDAFKASNVSDRHLTANAYHALVVGRADLQELAPDHQCAAPRQHHREEGIDPPCRSKSPHPGLRTRRVGLVPAPDGVLNPCQTVGSV